MKKVIVPIIWKPSKQLHFCKTNAVFHYKNVILFMLYTRQFFRRMSVHELKFIWMMQQDNDAKHQIKSTSEYLKRKKLN